MRGYKFAVIGMGPSGAILAAHLAKAGHDVVVVDVLLKHIEEISRQGLHIIGEAEIVARFNSVYNSISMLEDHDLDVIFVATKTLALQPVLSEIEKLYREGVKIAVYQNGIDNEELVARKFGKDAALRIVINHAGNILDNGIVRMTFFHRPNYIGALSEKSVDVAKDVADILTEADLTTEYAPDIKVHEWKKAILNAALAPISAITKQTMREVMQFPATRQLVEYLLQEAINAAKSIGLEIGESFFEEGVEYLATAGHHRPSMLIDLEEGHKTEIDYITGKIIELGAKSGSECPANLALLNLIKGLESKL